MGEAPDVFDRHRVRPLVDVARTLKMSLGTPMPLTLGVASIVPRLSDVAWLKYAAKRGTELGLAKASRGVEDKTH